MLCDRRCRSAIYSRRNITAFLSQFLESSNGTRSTKLSSGIYFDFFIYYISNIFSFLQLVDTTVEIAQKVGSAEIISRIVDDLKDENEVYRKMVMETIENIVSVMTATDIDSRLEEQLIDGILYAFQEQTQEVCLVCFISILSVLGCCYARWFRYRM